jgi:hypothetical protein
MPSQIIVFIIIGFLLIGIYILIKAFRNVAPQAVTSHLTVLGLAWL